MSVYTDFAEWKLPEIMEQLQKAKGGDGAPSASALSFAAFCQQ